MDFAEDSFQDNEIPKICSKCPIIIKDLGIIRYKQDKLTEIIEELKNALTKIYDSLNGNLSEKGWLNRIETLEKLIAELHSRTILTDASVNTILDRLETKINVLIKK